MDKLKMHTTNIADENFRKLAALFPNAVTETIDEATGEVVRAIDPEFPDHITMPQSVAPQRVMA